MPISLPLTREGIALGRFTVLHERLKRVEAKLDALLTLATCPICHGRGYTDHYTPIEKAASGVTLVAPNHERRECDCRSAAREFVPPAATAKG